MKYKIYKYFKEYSWAFWLGAFCGWKIWQWQWWFFSLGIIGLLYWKIWED